MQNRKMGYGLLAWIVYFLLLPVASADPVADELLRLGRETVLLKARAKQLEAQGLVESARAKFPIRDKSHAVPWTVPGVQAIEGIGGTLYATVSLGAGVSFDVKAGDMLSGGILVAAVNPGVVTFQDAKGRRAYARLLVGNEVSVVPPPDVVAPPVILRPGATAFK